MSEDRDHACPKSPPDHAAYIATLDCVHCGLCLQHCPTYLETGRESASPRGRLYLMRALLEGRTEATDDLKRDLDLCLVCRACETACPSGVRYGEILAETRAPLRKRGFFRRRLMGLMASRRKLSAFATILRFLQQSGLIRLARFLPTRLRKMSETLPPIPKKAERKPLPRFTQSKGERLGAVALFEGCIMPMLFGKVHEATLELLSSAGFDVHVPQGQTCCGALHEHDGDLETARQLLSKNARAFSGGEFVAIVTNSAGCGASLLGAKHWIGDEGKELAASSLDITRFLVNHGSRLRFRPAQDLLYTYDAPCHLYHAQRETSAPLELLARIPGARFVPMQDAALCCGAAGIYNLDEPEMSRRVLAQKLDSLERTGAKLLVSGNPGCIMQWQQGIRERGMDTLVLHPAVLLAEHLEPSK